MPPAVAQGLKKRHKRAMKLQLPTLLSALLFASTMMNPAVAQADEPEAVHRFVDDSLPPPSARINVLLAGTLITGAFYLPVLGASYAWENQQSSDMRIPVAGPWMALGKTRLCSDDPIYDPNCSDFMRVAGAVLLVFDGIGQAGGVAVLLQGIFMRTGRPAAEGTALYKTDFSSLSHTRPAHTSRPFTFSSGDFEMTPTPMVGDGSDVGLALSGKF